MLSLYTSSLLSKTSINPNDFVRNFTDEFPRGSKRKQFMYLLKTSKMLLLNKNHINALKFLTVYSFAEAQYEKLMLLVSKAISTGHYSEAIIHYLKENPHLLTIAVNPNTLNHLDSFVNLNKNDIPFIIKNINKEILTSNDETVIIKQIPKLISLLFITNKIDYVEYIKALLKFMRGDGLTNKIRLLLKELIKNHKIIFKFTFIDFFTNNDN